MTLDTFTNKTLVKFVLNFSTLERQLLLIKLHDPTLLISKVKAYPKLIFGI